MIGRRRGGWFQSLGVIAVCQRAGGWKKNPFFCFSLTFLFALINILSPIIVSSWLIAVYCRFKNRLLLKWAQLKFHPESECSVILLLDRFHLQKSFIDL